MRTAIFGTDARAIAIGRLLRPGYDVRGGGGHVLCYCADMNAVRRAHMISPCGKLLDSLHASLRRCVTGGRSQLVPVQRRRVILRHTLSILIHAAD